MPNIEFLGFSWNPFVFWWVLSLLAMKYPRSGWIEIE